MGHTDRTGMDDMASGQVWVCVQVQGWVWMGVGKFGQIWARLGNGGQLWIGQTDRSLVGGCVYAYKFRGGCNIQ